MKNDYSVLKILRTVTCKEVSRVELNDLIELTQSYAYTYLKYRYKNLHKIFLAEDLTLNEMAIDAIAPLFERDSEGVFTKIKVAFEKWQPPIDNEEQAQFFLNRLAAKSAEKYVSELLRDSDPFFSKILDQVNYQIEKGNYRKKQILGTTFIIENTEIQSIGSLPDTEFILSLPSDLFHQMNDILPKIFEFLKTNTEKIPAIPLNALVSKTKRVKALHLNFTDKVEIGSELKVDSILELALRESFGKLNDSYFAKGKISKDEKCGIEKALMSISADMKDGGINSGLHKYFLEQFPEVDFNSYKAKYQNIFEYLYKVFRKEIVKQMDESK